MWIRSVRSFLERRTGAGPSLSGESWDEKLNAIKRKVCLGRCISRFGRSPLSLPPLLAEFKFKLGLWGKIASRHKISCMANFNPFKLCSALSRAEYHLIILTKHLLRIPFFLSFFSARYAIRYFFSFWSKVLVKFIMLRANRISRNIEPINFFESIFIYFILLYSLILSILEFLFFTFTNVFGNLIFFLWNILKISKNNENIVLFSPSKKKKMKASCIIDDTNILDYIFLRLRNNRRKIVELQKYIYIKVSKDAWKDFLKKKEKKSWKIKTSVLSNSGVASKTKIHGSKTNARRRRFTRQICRGTWFLISTEEKGPPS